MDIFIKVNEKGIETTSDVKLPCKDGEKDNAEVMHNTGALKDRGDREGEFLFRFEITFVVILFNQQKSYIPGQHLFNLNPNFY